jgi:hypothetical protein
VLTLTLVNTTQIKHATCFRFLNTSAALSWTFDLDGLESPASYCPSTTYGTYALYVALGQAGFGLLLSMVGYSAGAAWDTLYCMQFA